MRFGEVIGVGAGAELKSSRRGRGRWLAAAIGLLACASPAAAQMCESAATAPGVAAALAQIEASVDPCGESADLAQVVREFTRCARRGYRVCVSSDSDRNFTESGAPDSAFPTTITWNPDLRSELELGCGGTADRPVLRDPVAQLLHEVVHAVQDCRGLNPADHELEAVRIENSYRRARGLCQRTRYGEEKLPQTMVVACEPGACRCAPIEKPAQQLATSEAGGAAARLRSAAAGDVSAENPLRRRTSR